MVLVALSVVEQRLDAVRAVLAGASVTEVAAAVGVSRVSVHAWLRRYLAQGLAGLADRSRRPEVSPRKTDLVVEVVLVEMRRQHPRWGAKRIRMELLRALPSGWTGGGAGALDADDQPGPDPTRADPFTSAGLLRPVGTS